MTLQPRVEGERRRDPKPSREQVISEIVKRIDAALALVLGSFPPAGRDLDLLVRPPAISGLDGAGKSFQARAVRETLEGLVVPSVIEWTHLGFNCAVDSLRAPKLRTLSPRPFRSFFLDVSPEVAHVRKGEYTIDELRRQTRLSRAEYSRAGAGLPEELCAEIAATVWTATLHPR